MIQLERITSSQILKLSQNERRGTIERICNLALLVCVEHVELFADIAIDDSLDRRVEGTVSKMITST